MQTHPERFPNGLKGVADHIHSLGLKAGIYSDAGSNTCGSIWDKDVNGVGSGLYGHEHQDADLYFNEWGFDFIKIDYCGASQELSLDEENDIRRFAVLLIKWRVTMFPLMCADGLFRVHGQRISAALGVSVVISARNGGR